MFWLAAVMGVHHERRIILTFPSRGELMGPERFAEQTSEQSRGVGEKYLASVLWFGHQTTFIFLQQTHTHAAGGDDNLVSHVNTGVHAHDHT